MGRLLPDAQENAIIAFIFNATGITTVWDDENTRHIPLPYITIDWLADISVDEYSPNYQNVDEDNFDYEFQNILTLEINAFAKITPTSVRAIKYLRNILRYAGLPGAMLTLTKQDVSIINDFQSTNNISGISTAEIESRAVLNIDFLTKETIREATGTIQNVNMVGEEDLDKISISI